MDKNYLTEAMGLRIIKPVFPGANTTNDHHVIGCRMCDHTFEATPKSKKQNFGKHGIPGCPKCTDKIKYERERAGIMEFLDEVGIELLEPYTNNKVPILMRNTTCCNRPFSARVDNVKNGRTLCPPCNNETKAERCKRLNQESHERAMEFREPFEAYTKRVRVLSEQAYRKHKDIINPNNYPRGRNHDYHLDHIRSISECFHNNVPPEDCAHYTNLQMLSWHDNISKGGVNRD